MSKIDDLFTEPTDELRQQLKEHQIWQEARYALCMLRLQEMAGLSYKEARAYMYMYRESLFTIADKFGTTMQGVYNLRRRAENKIRKSGYTQEEIFGEYEPGPILA